MSRTTAACALAVLCAAGPSAQTVDPTIAKRSGEMVAAFNAKDATKVATLYTEDGVLMPPNAAMVKGRAAIEGWFKAGISEGWNSLRLTPFRAEVSGDTAYILGTYTISSAGADDRGKYAEIWKRNAGQWHIVADIFNSDLPVNR